MTIVDSHSADKDIYYALLCSWCMPILLQERSKERLFEDELEVVWDKGSSGLVFYTDASYWDQQEGGELAVIRYVPLISFPH